jgi:hypothetical protein
MSIYYEWAVEWLDDYDDIIDVDHFPRLRQAIHHAKEMAPLYHGDMAIALVYNRVSDFDQNVEDRQWAYLENGALPAAFDGGAKIPKRFFTETTNVVVIKK